MLYQEKPNKYREMIQLNATPNPDCDICEEWLAGNYVIDICELILFKPCKQYFIYMAKYYSYFGQHLF